MAEPTNTDPARSAKTNPIDLTGFRASSSPDTGNYSNTMLGEFRLVRVLGTGGMAEVYLAEQTALRRQVAVKILRQQYLTNEQYVKRFRHEAAAAGSLNHPNIVQVYMVGEHEGVNYIAQEYVQGRTLKDYIKRKGPIEIKIALHIMRQIASALQVASENGIVHRDIKPENILLTNKGEAKVADFGLAQLTLQGERISLTQSGLTLGTPLYMSPEQVNGQPLDSRSDIYSFGIMAWQMLAGRPPFTGDSAMAVAVKHLNDKPPLISEFRPDLPANLVELIDRMIRKKREDRPADFAAIVTELKQIGRQVSGKEDTTGATRVAPKPTLIFDRPIRKQMNWLIAACMIALISSGGIGWAMRTGNPLLIESKGPPKFQHNADAQLYYAITNPHDESAWVATLKFNGASDEMKARANTALALIYLSTNRRKLAESTFLDLTFDSKYKVNGLAGQALIAELQGEKDTVRKRIADVDGPASRLFPEMDAAFKDLRTRYYPADAKSRN